MPRQLVADAQRLGFRLEPAAARILVDRMGANPVRLHHELERLALWAGEGGEVGVEDLGAMIADTSEEAVWSLSDALLERDAAGALRIGERLISQGENVTGLIYGLASRLRSACAAAGQLEEGMPPKQVESSLKMHPYAAKLLVGRLRDTNVADLRMATEALADLELWCRGGADYGDELALTARARWRCRDRGARRSEGVCSRSDDARWPVCSAQRRRASGHAGGFGLLAGAGVLVHGALLHGLVDLRDERALLARRSCSASPPSIAASRRRKWVFTVLVSRRFSARSRSLRRIRFFCEAMLAMSNALAGAVPAPGGRRL